jgi:hypothetical protein
MPEPSIDISYAYAQLGLAQGESLEEIRAVLTYAAAARFSTKARLAHVRKFVEFFEARANLACFDAPFAEIKKAYHRQAMELHPDRNKGGNEEQLKQTNEAYARIDAVQRQAKAYYKQAADVRREVEQEARRSTESERPAEAKAPPRRADAKTASAASGKKTTERRAAGSKKYLAAFLPRSIRAARLDYLPARTIIGYKVTKKPGDLNLVFDCIMLPEDQFVRARSYLAAPDVMGAALGQGKFSPPYILKDIKEIVVSAGEDDPEEFAKNYFLKVFGI